MGIGSGMLCKQGAKMRVLVPPLPRAAGCALAVPAVAAAHTQQQRLAALVHVRSWHVRLIHSSPVWRRRDHDFMTEISKENTSAVCMCTSLYI